MRQRGVAALQRGKQTIGERDCAPNYRERIAKL